MSTPAFRSPSAPPSAPVPSVALRTGQIIEIDRSHLAVARKLGVAKKFAAKVLSVATDPEHPGFAFVAAYSDKLASSVMVAIPPLGVGWIGPKVRIIR